MRFVKGMLVLMLLGCAFRGGAQQPMTPAQALARVLQQTPAQEKWFAPAFLAQIPASRIDAVVKQYTDTLGSFQRADATPGGFTVVMERGTAAAKIHQDGDGRIDGLWFGLPQPATPASLEDTVKELSHLPGKVSAVVLEEGQPMAALHPDDALAVGSAFKLAILAAALDQVSASKLRIDQVFRLKPEWKSLPSGVLQAWPDDTPLTVATLANEMISISDNTCADAMLSIAGRENAERFAPRNRPFLSTREVFALKAAVNAGVLMRYRGADEKGRRAMLAEIDRLPLPDAGQFGDVPVATDIEWFFTPGELCALVRKSADAPVFRINPGLADTSQWKQVAFKGGSEGGVLSLTTALTGRNGKHYCVSATWNNTTELDENAFFSIYGRFLSNLARASAE